MKVIGIVGTRRKDTEEYLALVEQKFLSIYEEGDVICSGLCKTGADRFAVILQKKYQTEFIWYPAKWIVEGKYHRWAGFERNTYIARDSNYLIAVVADDRTGGTEDTIKKFIKFHGSDNLIIIN